MQSKRACVALYLEEEYEIFMLKANFDRKQPNIPICNQPSFLHKRQ